jgi:hypothetical protein
MVTPWAAVLLLDRLGLAGGHPWLSVSGRTAMLVGMLVIMLYRRNRYTNRYALIRWPSAAGNGPKAQSAIRLTLTAFRRNFAAFSDLLQDALPGKRQALAQPITLPGRDFTGRRIHFPSSSHRECSLHGHNSHRQRLRAVRIRPHPLAECGGAAVALVNTSRNRGSS